MRMAVIIVLALVAAVSAGVWALGNFSGGEGPKAVASVKEIPPTPAAAASAAPTSAPTPVAKPAATPKPAAATPKPAPPSPSAAPSAAAAPNPAPNPAPSPAPAPSAPPTAASTSIEDQLKAKLAQRLNKELKLPTTSGASSPSLNPASSFDTPGKSGGAPAPATSEPPAPAPAPSEPAVKVASAPAKPAAGPAPAQPASAPAATPAAPQTVDAQLKSRKVTYNRPPSTLVLDKGIDLSLIIDATGQDQAAERLKDLPGTIVERDVQLSDNVAAELVGRDFDIQLQSAASRQKLSPRIANEWRWRVTPKALGPHTLTLTVYAYPNGSLDGEPIDSYRDEINVEVKQFDQVVSWAKSVQPLFAVIAACAGLLSATVAVLRFRRDGRKAA